MCWQELGFCAERGSLGRVSAGEARSGSQVTELGMAWRRARGGSGPRAQGELRRGRAWPGSPEDLVLAWLGARERASGMSARVTRAAPEEEESEVGWDRLVEGGMETLQVRESSGECWGWNH